MKFRNFLAIASTFGALLGTLASPVNAITLTLDYPKLTLDTADCASFSPTVAADGVSLNIVCNVAQVKPTCIVSASPASIASANGGPVTLTANCYPLTITNYAWIVNGAAGPSGTSNTLTQNITSTTTYAVKGTNSIGEGSPSANVVVTVGTPVVAPTCSAPTTTPITTTGGASTVSISCQGTSPITYAWTDPNGVVALRTASGTLSPAVTTTYTVTATNAAGTATATATVNVNIPAPPPTYSCGNLSPVYGDAQPYYDHTASTSYTTTTMRRGEAYVLSFTTGAAAANINMVSVQEYAGDVVTRYVNISKSPCDFTVPVGYNQRGTTALKYFTVGVPYGAYYQMLDPFTTYYVNIKNEDVVNNPGVDTCPAGSYCGFVLNFYKQ